MTGQSHILVVEDDTAIRRGLVDALTFAGHQVCEAADGETGLEMAIESSIDLVMLDVMLPGMNGMAVLQRLRQVHPTLPIIMVTARGGEDDRVRGLMDGADDYVVKPFSAKELLARVDAVLRRSPGRNGDIEAMSCGRVMIDLRRRELQTEPGASESLSERDSAILRYLAVHRDRAVDRDELLQSVWGLNPRGLRTRTVDMHIARLREKLAAAGAGDAFIETVRGKGYMLGPHVQVAPS